MPDWMKELEAVLSESLTEKQAEHFKAKLLPSIIADLNRLAAEKQDGEDIFEVYKLDDGSLSLAFTGVKEAGGLSIVEVRAD